MTLVPCPACGNPLSRDAVTCPKCGHPPAKSKTKKTGCGCLIVLVLIVIFIAIIINAADNDAIRPKYNPSSPETITTIIGSVDARATARVANGILTLTYSLDPWLLTASTAKFTMLSFAKRFFEQVFQSTKIDYACIVATATLKDIRGNTTQGRVSNLCVTRENAQHTNWPNMALDDIPRIADQAFIHPSFDK